MYTFDHPLFLALNFDGGPVLDTLMEAVSGTLLWIPLYAAVIWAVGRRCGWRSAAAFIVILVVAMGLADMLCGIFKHSGLLKDLWPSFPARQRPMFTSSLRGQVHVPSYAHGPYGTVSSHAATVTAMAVMSAAAIGRRAYTAFIICVTLLICWSRIYLACHFPVDLALGAAVGALAGTAMYFLWKKADAILHKYS